MKTLSLVIALAATACYSPNLGNSPFACGSDAPVCPDGYDCMSGVCVTSGGSAPLVDASGACADEAVEPNNSYSAPFLTPVASQFTTWELTGLAICPAGDLDYYEVQTTAMQTLTATITYGATGGALDMQLLDSNGQVMKNGTAVDGSANAVSASVADLPANTNYFIFVEASMNGGTNGYSLQITMM
ncbi:MAG TPA: hypothetical protein VGG74_16990 [Kofleriaceae bacterium]|jgi:hypothetical protein